MVRELQAFLAAETLLTQLPWRSLRMRATPAPSGALSCSSPLTLGEAVLVSSSSYQACAPPPPPPTRPPAAAAGPHNIHQNSIDEFY